MAIPITIPRLGWNMESGVFIGWLKPDGAAVRVGERLFTLESEKATEDVECLDAGTLRISPNGPKAGDEIAVGTVIGYMLSAGEIAPFEQEVKESTKIARVPVASPSVRRRARERGLDLQEVTGTGPSGRITATDVLREQPRLALGASRGETPPPGWRRGLVSGEAAISPRAKRVAREMGVDWTTLTGTGKTGRIRERDVRAAAPAARATTTEPSLLRRTIAERMLASHLSTAPVTLTSTADATNLVNLRNQFKVAVQATQEAVPSYTDFLVKLTAFALQKHPLLNAALIENQIRFSDAVHIGIAVDTDSGLLVPVLRDVLKLGLKEVAARSLDLIERARTRKLKLDELQGGTFTITNLGAFGIDAFTPILNAPQCAILGVGRIARRAVVRGEQIVVREQLTLSLTFDHRIVDGAPAARFLQTLCGAIENPGPWLLS